MTRWQGRVPLFVGVIGHRQLAPGEQKDLRPKVRRFLEELRARLPSTPIVVLSRFICEADQLVGSVALETGCELACVLPLEVASYRTVFGSKAARDEFERLLAASVVLGLPVSQSVAAEPERAHAQAGYFVARHATLLLALWDGTAPRRPDSVADLVAWRHAHGPGRRDATLCHVLVRRSERARAPDEARPVSGELPEPHPAARIAGAVDLPEPSAKRAIEGCGWNHAEKFNAAVSRSRFDLASALEPFTAVPDERVIDVAAVCRAAGFRARQGRTHLTRLKVLLQSIAFLAAVAFAAFFKFETHRWLLWVYLALLASALLLRTLIHRRALHHRYLDYRSLAEGLRVALFWRIASALPDTGSDSGASRFMVGPDASVGWIGAALTALDGWMGRAPLPESFDGCEFAARHWLGAEAGGDPRAQIPYYRAAASHLRRVATGVDRLVNLTLIGGVLSALVLAVLPSSWLGRVGPILTTVMGLMPLVSGTASAAVDVPAEQEMARQYEHMAHLLANAAERFAAAESHEERRRILFEAGIAALAEQRIWRAIVGQRIPKRRPRL